MCPRFWERNDLGLLLFRLFSFCLGLWLKETAYIYSFNLMSKIVLVICKLKAVNDDCYECICLTNWFNWCFIVRSRLLFNVNHYGVFKGLIVQQNINSTVRLNMIRSTNFCICRVYGIEAIRVPPRCFSRSVVSHAVNLFWHSLASFRSLVELVSCCHPAALMKRCCSPEW